MTDDIAAAGGQTIRREKRSSPTTSPTIKSSTADSASRVSVSGERPTLVTVFVFVLCPLLGVVGGSVAERLACWTQARTARVQIAAATLSGNSLGKLLTPIVPLVTKQQNW